MKVLKVTNAKVRRLIEQFTNEKTFPDVIAFTKDGNSDWIVSKSVLTGIRYTGIRSDLKQFLADNGVNANVTSLKAALQKYATEINYVKPIDT